MTENEARLASYHNTPFAKVCLGMTRNGVTNWILVNYNATSLHSLIADGKHHATIVGKEEWMLLINGATLQSECNKEGFNVKCGSRRKLRIGIASNEQDDCTSCDSAIGFGIEMKNRKWSSGNINKNKERRTFGYVFVQ